MGEREQNPKQVGNQESPDPPAPLTVNGERLPWRPGLSVAALLEERGAAGPGVAVERNLQVVRRAEHASTLLEPGDRIEIVRLVGGG